METKTGLAVCIFRANYQLIKWLTLSGAAAPSRPIGPSIQSFFYSPNKYRLPNMYRLCEGGCWYDGQGWRVSCPLVEGVGNVSDKLVKKSSSRWQVRAMKGKNRVMREKLQQEASWRRWHLRRDLEQMLMLRVSVLVKASSKCQRQQQKSLGCSRISEDDKTHCHWMSGLELIQSTSCSTDVALYNIPEHGSPWVTVGGLGAQKAGSTEYCTVLSMP